MREQFTTDLIDVIENRARTGFHEHGRGIVVCVETTEGQISEVFYVPERDAIDLFLHATLTPREFQRSIHTYDAAMSYMVMSVEMVNDEEADPTWYVFTYRMPQQVPSA